MKIIIETKFGLCAWLNLIHNFYECVWRISKIKRHRKFCSCLFWWNLIVYIVEILRNT